MHGDCSKCPGETFKKLINKTHSPITRDYSGLSDYILAVSSSRYYSKTEIQALSDWELEIARNEIYARYARDFNDKDLQEYFDFRGWYVKRYSAAEFDDLPSP
ncbi:MAG: YARHG domain-containing protein [Atopobiaceae bacterium]|nr:YARHG domain-containing protein [Atopobiaceae bacterium]